MWERDGTWLLGEEGSKRKRCQECFWAECVRLMGSCIKCRPKPKGTGPVPDNLRQSAFCILLRNSVSEQIFRTRFVALIPTVKKMSTSERNSVALSFFFFSIPRHRVMITAFVIGSWHLRIPYLSLSVYQQQMQAISVINHQTVNLFVHLKPIFLALLPSIAE